jgi:MoxR-like ATPase
LLEAMQEGQATVEGETFPLPKPFHVLATANPVEYEGTYPLPEAQLDRFLLRVSFGYPSAKDEWEVLLRRMERRQEAQEVARVTDGPGLLAMQRAIEEVSVDEGVGQYCVRLVAETRHHQNLLMGSSPRGSLALLLTSRAYAVLRGRDYVTPEDVKAVAHACLDHRVTVRPELWMNDVSASSVVDSILGSVPTPSATGAGARTGFERP